MSTYRLRAIQCMCGSIFEREVFDSVNASARPDVRESILAGEFHRFLCPRCEGDVTVESRLAYIDFARSQWFTVLPRIDLLHRQEMSEFARRSFAATMVDRAPGLVQAWSSQLVQRAIFGLDSLREKLLLFDAGLDDRVAECLKLNLCQALGLEIHPDMFMHIATIGREHVVVDHVDASGAAVAISVPRSSWACSEEYVRSSDTALSWLQPDAIVVDYRDAFLPRGTLVRAESE